MKAKHICFIVLALLVLSLVIADLAVYPLKGSSYDLLDVDKDQICAVKIWHYGKTREITDAATVEQLVEQFDCTLERRGNDYITNRTGGDWRITFRTQSGAQSKTFTFFPGNGTGETKLEIGHYYYAADVDLSSDFLRDLYTSEDTSAEPTETSAIEESTYAAALDYDPHNIETFVFSEELLDTWLYEVVGQELSACQKGALYRYHKDTRDLIMVASGPVAEYCYNVKAGYFYTLESNRQAVIQTDLMGQTHTPFYTAERGDITKLIYCGKSEGTLYTLEGNAYVVQIGYPEGDSAVFFHEDGMQTFFANGYPELEQFYYFKENEEFWVDLETGTVTKAVHP